MPKRFDQTLERCARFVGKLWETVEVFVRADKFSVRPEHVHEVAVRLPEEFSLLPLIGITQEVRDGGSILVLDRLQNGWRKWDHGTEVGRWMDDNLRTLP